MAAHIYEYASGHIEYYEECAKLLKLISNDDTFMDELAKLEAVPSIEIMCNCMKYYKLFMTYSGQCLYKYINLQNAINNSVKGDIIWKHEELGLYGVYKKSTLPDMISERLFRYILMINDHMGYLEEGVHNYKGFNRDQVVESNIQNSIKNKDDEEAFEPIQILLSSDPTKLIFECYNSKRIIAHYDGIVGDYFRSKSSHIILSDDLIQFTIEDLLYKTLQESIEAFKGFEVYIRDLDDKMPLPSMLKTIPCIVNNRPDSYREIKLDKQNIYKINSENQKRFISTVDTRLCNIVMCKNINTTNVPGATNNIIDDIDYDTMRWLNNDKNRYLLVKQLEKWVKNNPPKNKEINTVYYDRYRTFIGHLDKCLGVNKFVEIIETFGYEYIICGRGRPKKWINQDV
jgi:hypothetical protein